MIDPYWIDQIFLFDIPVLPTDSIRGYNIRVRVMSKSIIGPDTFLGQADVQFSSLIEENEICGWFSLKPRNFSIKSSPESLQVSGSIKLRAQWVHSPQGLVSYLMTSIERRRSILVSHLTHQQRILRKKQKIDINITKTPQVKLRPTIRNLSDTIPNSESEIRKRKPSVIIKSSIPEEIENNFCGDIFSSYYSYYNYYHNLSQTILPTKRALSMMRSTNVSQDNENFLTKIDDEMKRCFTHVNVSSGRIEITPVQALNLPSSDYPVYIQFRYGDDKFNTYHTPPTAHPTWLNTEESDRNVGEGQERYSYNNRLSLLDLTSPKNTRHENLTYVLDIDTLNIKGTICLCVIQDSFPKKKEICRLEIPIFSLLDCICTQIYGQEPYDRWFPLRNITECTPREGDMGTSLYSTTSEKLYSNLFQYHPCIRLLIRWEPTDKLLREKSIFYSRISLPALSISMIDSNRAREIMQISISDIEGRHNHSEESTDTSLIISWLQVDNQLPESISPVIVSPTCALRPQPAFRLHMKKNNILSHEHLESYDYFQIIIQELDFHLEQQIVVSVWDFVKSVMNDIQSREYEKSLEQESELLEPKRRVSTRNSGNSNNIVLPDITDKSPISNTDSDIDKIYIDHFYIAPIMINISFIMNPQALSTASSSSSTTTIIEQFDDKKSRSNNTNDVAVGESSLHLFLWQVGEVVLDLTSSISDAPIKLNGMTVDHLFKTWGEVSSILQNHYLNSALGQLYRIVGSLDLVGNPVGLLSSLGVGVRDFFYEPAYAIITTPTEFKKIGRGVVKGAVSLASNTADGLLGTATNVTRSFGKGVAALTMDEIFLRNRERLNKPPISTIGYFTRPIEDISNGIYCGVVGVIRVPYHGAKHRGGIGFILGVGKGIAGIAAKPVVGVLDAFTHTGDGVRYLVKSLTTKRGIPPKKRRHSNVFGPDGRLLPYSYTAAYGTFILRLIDQTSWEKPVLSLTNRSLSKGIDSESLSDERIGKINNNNNNNNSTTRIFDSFRISKSSGLKLDSNDLQDNNNDNNNNINNNNSTSSNILNQKNQINQMKLRRQSVKNPYVDSFHRLESVIYTAVLNRGIGLDQLVIITNLRVVVADCKQEKGGSSVNVYWQSKFSQLKKPILERSGGGTVSLVLSGVNIKLKRSNSQNDNTINITGDYEILRNLYNSLNTILHNFNLLIPLYHGDDTWEEDEQNLIHLGSWQYLRPYDKNEKIGITSIKLQDGISNLEECAWIYDLQKNNLLHDSKDDMTIDILSAISSHQYISSYNQKAIIRPIDSSNEIKFKEMLQKCLISGEEFDAWMSTVSIEHELISNNRDGTNLNKNKQDLNSKKESSGALSKLRKSVRKTINLLTPLSFIESNGEVEVIQHSSTESPEDKPTIQLSQNSPNLNSEFKYEYNSPRLRTSTLDVVDEKSDDDEKDNDSIEYKKSNVSNIIPKGLSRASLFFRNIDDNEFNENDSNNTKNNNFSFLPSGFLGQMSPNSKEITQKTIQNVKKTYTSVSQSDHDDSSLQPESLPQQNDEIKEESSGNHTTGMNQSNYSLLFDGIEGDAISAISNGDSVSIVEVMDRLGRMEELLTTIMERSKPPLNSEKKK